MLIPCIRRFVQCRFIASISCTYRASADKRAMALQLQRVLISDSVDASCRRILEEGGVAVDYRPGLSKEDLLACIKVC